MVAVAGLAQRAARRVRQRTDGPWTHAEVPFGDLRIDATALHLDYGGATLNHRDFQRIPGLRVVTL